LYRTSGSFLHAAACEPRTTRRYPRVLPAPCRAAWSTIRGASPRFVANRYFYPAVVRAARTFWCHECPHSRQSLCGPSRFETAAPGVKSVLHVGSSPKRRPPVAPVESRSNERARLRRRGPLRPAAPKAPALRTRRGGIGVFSASTPSFRAFRPRAKSGGFALANLPEKPPRARAPTFFFPLPGPRAAFARRTLEDVEPREPRSAPASGREPTREWPDVVGERDDILANPPLRARAGSSRGVSSFAPQLRVGNLPPPVNACQISRPAQGLLWLRSDH